MAAAVVIETTRKTRLGSSENYYMYSSDHVVVSYKTVSSCERFSYTQKFYLYNFKDGMLK